MLWLLEQALTVIRVRLLSDFCSLFELLMIVLILILVRLSAHLLCMQSCLPICRSSLEQQIKLVLSFQLLNSISHPIFIEFPVPGSQNLS